MTEKFCFDFTILAGTCPICKQKYKIKNQKLYCSLPCKIKELIEEAKI